MGYAATENTSVPKERAIQTDSMSRFSSEAYVAVVEDGVEARLRRVCTGKIYLRYLYKPQTTIPTQYFVSIRPPFYLVEDSRVYACDKGCCGRLSVSVSTIIAAKDRK
jgi:hypothetical protein